MRISSITVKNFRCFGNEPTTVQFRDITALIGSNGAGKTAVLLALSRVFGVAPNERRILTEDFHVPKNKKLEELSEIKLSIEVRLDFPELENSSSEGLAVPQCFNQMVVSGPEEVPYCRVRLEATWTKSNLPQGDIEEATFWITTPDKDVADDNRSPMPSYARSMVHVLYVPAFRDAARQLSQVTGSLVYRLFQAIEWSEETRDTIKASSNSIRDSVHSEVAIRHIHDCLAKSWSALHDFPTFKTVLFQPVGSELDHILRHVEAVFSPGTDGLEHPIDRLSDGLKSLFYFALVASVFQVEESVKKQSLQEAAAEEEEVEQEAETQDEETMSRLPISFDELKPPALTVFAVEEPENHLAPYYLGRILASLQSIAVSDAGQVILTSHSPSIMARIDPEDVVYLRHEPKTQSSTAHPIILPPKEDDAFTFIKEAVRAYPELYFARLVVLGEGDSEEVVIPRLAKVFGTDLDGSFAAVVPLGGRHANHFWRLLHGLDIPHVTLLDLDRERNGGGWARIHYAITQLLKVGIARNKLLTVNGKAGNRVLSDDEFEAMKAWDVKDVDTLKAWAEGMEEHNVYFCSPLDLDFCMLRAFQNAYQGAWDGTPQIPDIPSDDYDKRIRRACIATLKGEASTGVTFNAEEKHAFIWYSYLFLGKGKPVTHLLALGNIPEKDLKANAPDILKRFVGKIKTLLPRSSDND
jgi:predicted ATPase